MKNCAYCGCENADNATRCCECGTEEFIDPALPPPSSPQQQIENVVETSDPEPDVGPDDESVLCTSCLFPNLPEISWCKRCGGPIGSTTSIVPTDAILTMGFVYRGAVEGRPKLLVVIGVWVLFFPSFVANVVVLLGVLGGLIGGIEGLAYFWFSLVGGAICSTMLYRATRNYIVGGRPKQDEIAEA